ncbi:MAG: radical SAM protein, partial [Ilumatobacter sp.]|nr:radical SAM protein [Ilumatobacter sp.]
MMKDVTPNVAALLESALSGKEISEQEAERLLCVEGADFHALTWAADQARREDVGEDVSYVVCRNLNFTNICYVGCSFCGFARHKHQADAYVHPIETILEKCADGVARGATEICIQGGIHPKKTHDDYRNLILQIKEAFPQLHLHAFSPEEIDWGHRKSDMELTDYLRWLVDAGVSSLPGTAAEILDDEIRQILSPRKLKTARWVEIIEAAHSIGLP